ncbi:sodium/bile acid cotransporter 7-B [Nilaparvata lugens]|uniref:sodium/bile acid cotransporter 7-B n=1 Tax=Nilaparvata lugens TaxID=108931 RepID=UPI00193E8913|nr:sodium/bile acid cotransporter 7-B [Nilaparvata lugens]
MEKSRFKLLLRKYWFLLGILGAIFLAELVPSLGATGGPLKPEWTVKYVAVSLIFFLSGMSLSFSEMKATTSRIKVHFYIQAFTFLFIPLLIMTINVFLRNVFAINEWILKGLATVSCMPPPVSSAVILTRAVGGNEAVAVFNSVIGSLIGLFFTPLVLLLMLGKTAVVSTLSSIYILCQTVLLPLLVGQTLRSTGLLKYGVHQLPLSSIGQMALLFIIFTTFCDAFRTHDIPMNAADILITVFLVVLIQMIFLYISFELSNYFSNTFAPSDVVAITFCSTHKSLTLGIPILRILFSGYAHFSQITLPFLIYHPTQIILGGLLVPYLKRWINSTRSRSKLLP